MTPPAELARIQLETMLRLSLRLSLRHGSPPLRHADNDNTPSREAKR